MLRIQSDFIYITEGIKYVVAFNASAGAATKHL